MVESNKRNSIFSNSSFNGFNSLLFLPSEFNADDDSETWIPIRETIVTDDMSQSKERKMTFLDDADTDNLEKLLDKKFNNISINEPTNKPSLNRNRRFSTPVDLSDKLKRQFIRNYEDNKKFSFNQKRPLDIVNDDEEYYLESEKHNDKILINEESLDMKKASNTEVKLFNFPLKKNMENSQSMLNSFKNESTKNESKLSYNDSISTLELRHNERNTGNLSNLVFPSLINFQPQPITMNTMVYHHIMQTKEKQKKRNTSKLLGHLLRQSNSNINAENLEKNDNIINKAETCDLTNKNKKKKKMPQAREGDWVCSSCHNLNFSFRTACNKCPFERKTDS